MTIAPAKPANVDRAFLIRLLGVLAVLALIGVVLLPRGPDPAFAPVMAERPVILPDGSSLFVQKYEVTVAEWNACHAAGACTLALRVRANQSEAQMPATGLSYVDVSEYLAWINQMTRMDFRLPTIREWEYMAAEVLPPVPDPIFTDPALSWASAYIMEPQTPRALRPQDAFDTTSQGIVDLNGSVWEWTQDCYTGTSEAQLSPDRCAAFFVGGEHIAAVPYLERDPARGGCAAGAPPAHLGMRLVRDRHD